MHFRSLAVGFGALGLAAALAGAPLGLSGGLDTFGGKAALAKPGNGQGNGKGHAKGKGIEAASESSGVAKGAKSSGTANGRALGLASNDAVSGMPPGQAKKADLDGTGGKLGIKGSFNAIHASVRAFEVASANSRVQKVRSYLEAAERVSDIEQADPEDPDLDAAIQAAAEAAVTASSQSVTRQMLESVHAYANARELADIDISDRTTQEIADRADGDGEVAADEGAPAE